MWCGFTIFFGLPSRVLQRPMRAQRGRYSAMVYHAIQRLRFFSMSNLETHVPIVCILNRRNN